MSSAYYYLRSGVRTGPVSWEQLKAVAQSGNLLPTDLVWHEGMAEWRPARELAGLFETPMPTATLAPPLPAPTPPAPVSARQASNIRTWLVMAAAVAVLGLLGVCVIALLWTFSDRLFAPHVFADVYRIAPGDYELKREPVEEKGTRVTEKFTLIPKARILAKTKEILTIGFIWHATDGVTVERIEPGKQPEVRPFKDAIGPGRWLSVQVASDRHVRFLASNITDNLTESGRNTRYIVHVPKGKQTLISHSKHEVEAAEKKLAGRPEAVKAMQRLDEFAARLRDLFGEESGITGEFADRMRPIEEAWFSGPRDPNPLVEKEIEAFTKSLSAGDARETLCLLSVVHGDVLTDEQTAGAKRLLGAAVADDYAGLGGPDGFEPRLQLLRRAAEDVRGPTIVKERQEGGTHLVEYAYFYQKNEELRRYLAKEFRAQQKDLAAGERLNAVLRQAQASGPLTLAGENVFNLDYTIDMTGTPAQAYRTSAGYAENSYWFWERMFKQYPKLFDDANRKLLQVDQTAPIVNDHWLTFFPSHAAYKGQKLQHHHLGRSTIATPVPVGAHAKSLKAPE